jgi:guanine deaminase
MIKVYKGTFIDTPTPESFRVRDNHYALCDEGVLKSLTKHVPREYESLPVTDLGPGIVIPSFIDLHIHAPQHMQMGVGLDLELLDWLNTLTFPGETRFTSPEYARELYPLFAADLVRQGTLRAVVYGTVHSESTMILAEELEKAGLKAFVGKVNMDCHAPPELLEDRRQSLEETEAFCLKLGDKGSIRPILTPRFAPSCSIGLMKALGALSHRDDLPVQSHLSETVSETRWVSDLFPDSRNYTQVYDQNGLLGKGSLMAHAIFLNDEEVDLIVKRETTLVHCPSANSNLGSGIMPLARYLDRGVSLGLGTDVGAGHTTAMYRVITQAVTVSKLLKILQREKGQRAVSLSEAFFLATAGNGKFFEKRGMGSSGVFQGGMSFDALVLDMGLPPVVKLTPLNHLERFLYSGDDRNIKKRISGGKEL